MEEFVIQNRKPERLQDAIKKEVAPSGMAQGSQVEKDAHEKTEMRVSVKEVTFANKTHGCGVYAERDFYPGGFLLFCGHWFVSLDSCGCGHW
jgi:hypothetical protein